MEGANFVAATGEPNTFRAGFTYGGAGKVGQAILGEAPLAAAMSSVMPKLAKNPYLNKLVGLLGGTGITVGTDQSIKYAEAAANSLTTDKTFNDALMEAGIDPNNQFKPLLAQYIVFAATGLTHAMKPMSFSEKKSFAESLLKSGAKESEVNSILNDIKSKKVDVAQPTTEDISPEPKVEPTQEKSMKDALSEIDPDEKPTTPQVNEGIEQPLNEPINEKPTPTKINVLGKELNSYNNYIPKKIEDVEPDAIYSFTATSKEGIPTMLQDKATKNTSEINGVKKENWHSSVSGDELGKLFEQPKAEPIILIDEIDGAEKQSIIETPKIEIVTKFTEGEPIEEPKLDEAIAETEQHLKQFDNGQNTEPIAEETPITDLSESEAISEINAIDNELEADRSVQGEESGSAKKPSEGSTAPESKGGEAESEGGKTTENEVRETLAQALEKTKELRTEAKVKKAANKLIDKHFENIFAQLTLKEPNKYKRIC